MKGYSADAVFTPATLRLHAWATAMVQAVDDSPLHSVRCHELARAAFLTLCERQLAYASVTPTVPPWHRDLASFLHVADGRHKLVEHSWLLERRGQAAECAGVGVVSPSDRPWYAFPSYAEASLRKDIDHAMVERLARVMREQGVTP